MARPGTNAGMPLASHSAKSVHKRVLELGSGLSTLIMAYAFEAAGAGMIVTSLEDHAGYAEQNAQSMLREHGLEDYASVIEARY